MREKYENYNKINNLPSGLSPKVAKTPSKLAIVRVLKAAPESLRIITLRRFQWSIKIPAKGEIITEGRVVNRIRKDNWVTEQVC